MKKLFIALMIVAMGGMAMAQTENGRKGMTEWTGNLSYEMGNYYGLLSYVNINVDCRHYITNTFALGAGVGFGQYGVSNTTVSPATYTTYPELMVAVSMRKTFETDRVWVPYLGMRAGVQCDPAFAVDWMKPMVHAGIGVEYNVSKRNGLLLELGYTMSDLSTLGLSFGLRF